MNYCKEHESDIADDWVCECIAEYIEDLKNDYEFESWRDRGLD